MSKYTIDVEQFDNQVDLIYSYIAKFVSDDGEDFQMALTEYGNLAYLQGWANAIDMVIDVCGSMYNGYNQETLEELRQRIV